MNKAGNREQGAGVRGRHGLAAVRRCPVKGCCNMAELREIYCGDCASEIAYLRQWHARRDARESRVAMAFFHACSAVRRRLWIPLTVFVIAALLAFGAAWGQAACEWLADGGLLP